MKIVIVGSFGGTHLGRSFADAATRLGLDCLRVDVSEAWKGNALLRRLSWRVGDRRPLRMREFGEGLVELCRGERPELLLATGNGALSDGTLDAVKHLGVRCMNFSSDDPWNPNHIAKWHLRALPAYDVVFTPRRANIEDFHRLGCRDVRYLPFGYDDTLFYPPDDVSNCESHDVLFVGGADRDRVAFMTEFLESGLRPALIGGYWERYPKMRPYALGHKSPDELRALTAAAKVNLCLVRRANRDGHVMRSFEIAAVGGCMLAEDTPEHREIFGEDENCVRYFRTAKDAAKLAYNLLGDSIMRQCLIKTTRDKIRNGRHTYADRLNQMLSTAVHGQELAGLAVH